MRQPVVTSKDMSIRQIGETGWFFLDGRKSLL
jgi:hypothetical protein